MKYHEEAVNDPGVAGRTAVVTGGATGIGAAYTTALVEAGANVLIADLPSTAESAHAVIERMAPRARSRAVFTGTDVTEEREVDAAVEAAQRTFGSVDILVNNAAVYGALGAKRSLERLTPEDWDTVLRVNVRGTWQAMKAVVPAMRAQGGGRVVNISSVVARTGVPGFTHYVAAKAAVEGLTRAASRELGEHGITVNAVAPGLVDGEASRGLNDSGYFDDVASSRALAGPLYPEDLVGAVLWLCSGSSRLVTGQTIVVDGGGLLL